MSRKCSFLFSPHFSPCSLACCCSASAQVLLKTAKKENIVLKIFKRCSVSSSGQWMTRQTQYPQGGSPFLFPLREKKKNFHPTFADIRAAGPNQDLHLQPPQTALLILCDDARRGRFLRITDKLGQPPLPLPPLASSHAPSTLPSKNHRPTVFPVYPPGGVKCPLCVRSLFLIYTDPIKEGVIMTFQL